ncbi:MAG TPA: GreA/GreB family elongation factor [Ramlibacter sp.]|nr:GreA/GreB family elongation factor [Ramlibacter sp.]
MQPSTLGERKLTRLDVFRLRKLITAGRLEDLAELLDEADVLDPREIPADVVTMHAQVVIRELDTQQLRTLALRYPVDAAPAEGCVSVLSPVGMSLLGQRVGAVASWLAPGGEEHFVQVESILYQPEATGDYLT